MAYGPPLEMLEESFWAMGVSTQHKSTGHLVINLAHKGVKGMKCIGDHPMISRVSRLSEDLTGQPGSFDRGVGSCIDGGSWFL